MTKKFLGNYFFNATVSAKIDRVDLLRPAGVAIPSGLDGRITPYGQGFAVHDPSPSDLRKLSTYALIKAEIAVDSRPKRSIRGAERQAQFEQINLYLAIRHWPFDAPGVRPHFRVTGTRPNSDEPETWASGFRQADHEQDGAILGEARSRQPSLPWLSAAYRKSATRYMGDKEGYQGPNAEWNEQANFAEIKQYFKDFDNNQALPHAAHCVRLEVTFSLEGLKNLQVHNTMDLIALDHRKVLAPYFRLIDPAKVGRQRRPSTRRKPEWLARAIELAWKSLIGQVVQDHGVIALMHLHHPQARRRRDGTHAPHRWIQTAMPNRDSRDEAANRKIGMALGRLSRSLRAL